MLSDCLEEIEQYSSSKIKNLTIENSIGTETKPLCSFAEEQQLQKLIDQLENMFNSNEVIIFFNLCILNSHCLKS